jgi:hypothetical protein
VGEMKGIKTREYISENNWGHNIGGVIKDSTQYNLPASLKKI